MTARRARRLFERIQDVGEALQNIEDDLGQSTREQFLADGKTP